MVTPATAASASLDQTLASWIWPLSINEFRQRYWLQEPFVSHREGEAVAALAKLCPSKKYDAEWLQSLGGLPQVPIRVDGNTVEVASVAAREAVKFLRTGHPIYVVDPERLTSSAENLSQVFDLPRPQVSTIIQISSQGNFTPLHFDAADTFAIQIRGKKLWRYARNDDVPLPLEHWGFGKPLPPSIRSYSTGELRKEKLLSSMQEVLATPGTVMYLPRGYWHTTETAEESISAHIHYRAVSWADLLYVAIRRELSRRPEWRRPAFGLGTEATERRRAAAELAPLLSKLPGDLGGLSVSDLIGPGHLEANSRSSVENAKYKRVALSSVGIESTENSGAKVMRFVLSAPLGEVTSEFAVPDELVPVCLWISARSLTETFGVDNIAGLGVSRADGREILATLASAGMIELVRDKRE